MNCAVNVNKIILVKNVNIAYAAGFWLDIWIMSNVQLLWKLRIVFFVKNAWRIINIDILGVETMLK